MTNSQITSIHYWNALALVRNVETGLYQTFSQNVLKYKWHYVMIWAVSLFSIRWPHCTFTWTHQWLLLGPGLSSLLNLTIYLFMVATLHLSVSHKPFYQNQSNPFCIGGSIILLSAPWLLPSMIPGFLTENHADIISNWIHVFLSSLSFQRWKFLLLLLAIMPLQRKIDWPFLRNYISFCNWDMMWGDANAIKHKHPFVSCHHVEAKLLSVFDANSLK